MAVFLHHKTWRFVMTTRRATFAVLPLICAAMLFTAGQALATSVAPEGSATGTGPWDITSQCTPSCPPYTNLSTGDVAIHLTTPILFSSLATLSASFTDIAGGAEGGAPRFSLQFGSSGYLHILLGTSPNFNDSDPAAFTTAYSDFNVIGNEDTGRYDDSQFGGSPFTTYSHALGLLGGLSVTDIFFVLDGGWGANGMQHLTLNSIDVNGTIYAANSPLPAALPLFGSGLGMIGLLGWRKKRKRAVA
jgi:hypothetical protein